MSVLADRSRLAADVLATIEDGNHDVCFSAISVAEIAIKFALGRADFRLHPNQAILAARQASIRELPFESHVAARLADLPLHHRDPFDRMLVGQAVALPARLYTTDARLPVYSELVTFVG